MDHSINLRNYLASSVQSYKNVVIKQPLSAGHYNWDKKYAILGCLQSYFEVKIGPVDIFAPQNGAT